MESEQIISTTKRKKIGKIKLNTSEQNTSEQNTSERLDDIQGDVPSKIPTRRIKKVKLKTTRKIKLPRQNLKETYLKDIVHLDKDSREYNKFLKKLELAEGKDILSKQK